MDTVHLAAIDKAIKEGGGWARINATPHAGGEHNIWRFVELGILEEEDGFVRRAADPKEALHKLSESRARQKVEDDAAGNKLKKELKP